MLYPQPIRTQIHTRPAGTTSPSHRSSFLVYYSRDFQFQTTRNRSICSTHSHTRQSRVQPANGRRSAMERKQFEKRWLLAEAMCTRSVMLCTRQSRPFVIYMCERYNINPQHTNNNFLGPSVEDSKWRSANECFLWLLCSYEAVRWRAHGKVPAYYVFNWEIGSRSYEWEFCFWYLFFWWFKQKQYIYLFAR